MALEEERRNADDLRGQLTILERKRIALQTELEDVRGLLEAVSLASYCSHSLSSGATEEGVRGGETVVPDVAGEGRKTASAKLFYA